ncbi:MAG: transglycosylase SLT domain-containing protein [Bdellovibrionales bacterium]|nr:transglycosylase SLT domain-containing protein [Bdellovibrionales bacterium]
MKRNSFLRPFGLGISFLLLALVGNFHAYMAEGTSDEETPVIMTDMEPPHPEAGDLPWTPPRYEDQQGALGYEGGTFVVPVKMLGRVSFWIDIYSKYSTDQGLIHDSQYVNLVYEEVDFSDIMKQEDLTLHQKTRARKKRVDEAKKAIRNRLHQLQKLKSSEGLQGEDLRYWQLFSTIDEKNKFREAALEGRLRFQLGQKDRFEQGIHYSGRYLAEMEEIFRQEKLPIELTRMPFVESSFNLKARSRVGASGIWQFMRSTGRQYLKINSMVDERNEPLMATRAAARLLRSNYNVLESWPLAITAYNHGPTGVKRLVRKFKTSDISELIEIRKGRFGFASANFYASFLAALEVEKKAKTFFSQPIWMRPLKSELFQLDKAILSQDLVDFFNGKKETAQEFNPHLHSRFWSGRGRIPSGTRIRILPGTRESLVAKLKELKRQPSGQQASSAMQSYRVKRGDTLSDIARQFGVTVQDILNHNDIVHPRFLRAGEKILIPEP